MIAPIISIQTSFILLFAISLFYLLRIEMVSLFLVYNFPFFFALALALSRSMTVTSEPLPSSLYPMSLPDRRYRLVSRLNLMTRHDHVFLLALPHKQEICS